MKKLLSVLCALSIAAGAAGAAYASEDEKQYTSEGGYFEIGSSDKEVYIAADGTRYTYYYNTETQSVALHYVTSQSGDVSVPSSIDGVPVTSVDGYGGSKGSLVNLVIPDSVTKLGMFESYVNLKSVRLSGALSRIEYATFKNCTSLESIEIPSSVIKIERSAFNGCESLKKVTLNEGLETIERFAFGSCSVDSLVIPSTVKTIGDSGLARMGLKSVTFLGVPETIEDGAFSSNYELTEVNGLSREELIRFWNAFRGNPWQDTFIDEDEPFLTDASGTLVAYAGTDTDVVIPDTVKSIGNNAFFGKDITSVTIPDSVLEIGEKAFYQCEELTEITIPASVTKIGQLAFGNCYKLKNVTFKYSDTRLDLGTSSFSFTLVSPETLVTNDRKYSNQNTAFENTYFQEDYVPVLNNGEQIPKESEEPTEEPQEEPTETPKPQRILTVMTSDDGVEIVIDGKSVVFKEAKPFIDANDRTQIPIRAAAELLGCQVEWDEASSTVTITDGDEIIKMTIGSLLLQKGEGITEMDTAPVIVNDSTYIPVRFAGEALGLEVKWQE